MEFKQNLKMYQDIVNNELEKYLRKEECPEKTLNNSISAYKPTTSAYTISDLMKACSETNSAEEEYINSQSDLNAAILKNKNMKQLYAFFIFFKSYCFLFTYKSNFFVAVTPIFIFQYYSVANSGGTTALNLMQIPNSARYRTA